MSIPEEQVKKIAERIYWNPFLPEPTEKQLEFLAAPEPEVLFGGGGGSGKTFALLMDAALYVDKRVYRAKIFRRTVPNLKESVIPRAEELWKHDDRVKRNKTDHTWTFPSGAVIELDTLQNDDSTSDKQGAEVQYVGIDEGSEFNKEIYDYLHTRARRKADAETPMRFRITSNPINNFQWMKREFPVGEKGRSSSDGRRRYIHSDYTDNPHIDQEDYKQRLSRLPKHLEAKILRGDWSSFEGGDKFPRNDAVLHDSVPSDVNIIKKVRYWDMAATEPKPGNPDPDYCCGVLAGLDAQNHLWILDVKRCRREPPGVQRFVEQVAREDGITVPQYIEKEGGSEAKMAIDHYATQVLPNHKVMIDNVNRGKNERSIPLQGRWQNGFVNVLRGDWTPAYLDEMDNFEDSEQDDHDDQVDATSGADRYLYQDQGVPWDA